LTEDVSEKFARLVAVPLRVIWLMNDRRVFEAEGTTTEIWRPRRG
jgi:hypothetical protein